MLATDSRSGEARLEGAGSEPYGGTGDAQPEAARSEPDGGPPNLAETGGGSLDVPSVCQSPLTFLSNITPPSMCHGVVLKIATVPFDPADSRWSSAYQGCLANYGSLVSPDPCRELCTDLVMANATLRSSQGIASCTLDCSQPQSPVLAVEYSDTICEPIQPDGGPSTVKSDAGIDTAPDAGIDGAPDTMVALDGGDGGSQARVVLRSVYAYGNCMPVISEDPILVMWTVDITGARGDTAQLTKATITVSSGTSIVQDFTVANPSIALVGGAGSADQRKPVAVVSPNSACSQMCGGATYRLDLVYAIDGQIIAVSQSGNFSCAY